MGLTKFPNGVSSFGIPVIGSGPVLTTGSVFFVDSNTGSDNNQGKDSTTPLATLDYAVSLCTASKGDVIFLMPGHTETLGNEQIDLDVAGISVLGLGTGPDRPNFNFGHANSQIDIGANGITVANITCTPTITVVAGAFDIEAAVTDTQLLNIEALDGASGLEFVDFILVKAGCDRTNIDGLNYHHISDATEAQTAVSLVGASDRVRIANFWIEGSGAGWVAGIQGITTLSTRILIEEGVITADAEPGIELLTNTTGTIKNVSIFGDLATIDAATVADKCAHFDVKYVEVGNEAGTLVKTESVDD
jgi:hypothetical protein